MTEMHDPDGQRHFGAIVAALVRLTIACDPRLRGPGLVPRPRAAGGATRVAQG